MLGGLAKLPKGAIVVLHACCHNPTGVDLGTDDWKRVIETVREHDLVPFLDIAYQGFGDGIEADAIAVRLFADAGLPFFVASSFSKSFSLYGERVGALSIVTGSHDEAHRVQSQLKRVIRTNYSNPPTHGAAVVAAVLNHDDLRATWETELGEMRERIRTMRRGLTQRLSAHGDFGFIEAQRGMFSYSGLSSLQVDRLRTEFGIYAVGTGRICVAALNDGNLDRVAEAIARVI
jgi:aromatic-amino-acid transaminase